jgi:ketosteroid isomerase-like protein
MDGSSFRQLLETIASAWNEGDTATALACFTEDARYTEPPDTQHYEGRQELFEFFGGDDPPPMRMTWHTILFDGDRQMGAAEYTYTGTNTYHGVVVIRLRDDLIANWREYQVRSDLDWNAFTALNRF